MFYNCVFNVYSGLEDYYVFTSPVDDTVLFKLSYPGPYDPDILVLEDCDSLSCIDWGDESIIVPVTAGKRYYIIVDSKGSGNPAGNYTLTVRCSRTPVPALISPYMIVLVMLITCILLYARPIVFD